MRKLILKIHTSLDCFVAGEKGEFDNFDKAEENLEFVCKITGEADTALFGRISYQLLDSYWPSAKDQTNSTKGEIAFSNWYNSAQKVVISKTIPGDNLKNTIVINNNISKEITNLKKLPGKNILFFGGSTVTQLLMQHNLIDEYWIFINPRIFGKGIPLFNRREDLIKLKLNAAKQFNNGEIALNYTVVRH